MLGWYATATSPRLTKLAIRIGRVGCSRSNSWRPSSSAGPPCCQNTGQGVVVGAQFVGDGGQMRRPRRNRVGGIGLGIQHWCGLVDQRGDRVKILAGVDDHPCGALYEASELGAQTADGGVAFVDHRLEILPRYGLQSRVESAPQDH